MPDLTRICIFVFWLCAAQIFYAFIGYPLILIVAACVNQVFSDARYAVSRGQRRQRSGGHESFGVSLVFAAHDEAEIIEEKMRNCGALNYPGVIEILVGCDACSDDTAVLARASGLPNLHVSDYRERSGKPMVLNRMVPQAAGEIVVFSDANTMLDRDAILHITRHFADPDVGCVSGELHFTTHNGAVKSEGAYWRYEQLLKFFESRLNMLVGANGGVFAIRRELFTPLPRFAIIDDFLIAMRIRAAGYKVVYDPQAIAYEETAADARQEFQRRKRIGAGAFHALRYTWKLLLPTAGSVCFSYWSHKIFRWLVPFALAFGLLCAIFLSGYAFYRYAALVGLGVIAAASYGYSLEVRGRAAGIFSIPYYFLSMNLALMLGFFRFLAGSQTGIWRRTAR
ncbi:MAG: glycosyltransferase [Acidobacteriota bacterium]|nr:glycosyltransferase [Acidobacteriota bacterium]